MNGREKMPDVRLIERWLPISELGEESVRERRSMTSLPPIYYLHVWWARRPLVASRAAVLASVLPAEVQRNAFLEAIGIQGDAIEAKRLIAKARRTGIRTDDPYGYERAFKFNPRDKTEQLLNSVNMDPSSITILDPTAGGGSIPFEATRLGFNSIANDLNPVAATILAATIDYPRRFGYALLEELSELGKRFRSRVDPKIKWMFPQLHGKNSVDTTYLLARTIVCPYCSAQIPLSPNWRLNNSGVGVRLLPKTSKADGARYCEFEIVHELGKHSTGTVSGGDATCPFHDCARVIDGDEVKRQAQTEGMGEQIFAVVYQKLTKTINKSGKAGKPKWVRDYRSPQSSDNINLDISACLSERLLEWEALDDEDVVQREPHRVSAVAPGG